MKNFKIIIALLMIICVIAVVCSCSKDEKHYHSYSAEWNSDANNHWHVCTGEDCDNIVGITPHKFGEGVVTTPATEESDGLMTYKCSVCGFEKNETIAKLPVGHKHELQKVDGVEPTCVDKGVETYYVCSCGMKFADEQGENEISYPVVIDEKGHTPVDFGEHVDPTCDTAGIEKGKKCSDCGIIITEEKMISPLGHTWNEGAITKHATCFSEGVKTFECTVCGAKKTEAVAIDANAHVWNGGVVTKPATCSAEGEKTYTCTETLCGAKKTETVAIDANAHKWNEGQVTTPATCSNEGVKTFTCTHDNTHTKTEAVAIDANAHAWNEGVITTKPTCVKEGEKTYTCTHNSAHTKIEAVAVDANAHSWLPATCEAPSTCSSCGSTTGAELGHIYTSEVTTQPDCTTPGVRTYTCQNDNSHTYTEVEPALGHKIIVDKRVEATCTKTGLTEGQHCERCDGATVEQSVIPMISHTYDDDNDADCNACGAIRDVSCKHTNTEVIEGYAATCTVNGLTDGLKCKDCGEIIENQQPIVAEGHKDEVIPSVDATCTTSGLTEGKKCSVCKEILVEQKTVNALGHSPKEAVKENEKAADCINAGSYDLVVYCSVCSEKISTEAVTVGALGHTEVVDAAKAPTCTEVGLTVGKHCEACGTVLVAQNEISMLSHDWNVSNVTVEGAVGTVTYTCSVCGTVEQKSGPVMQENHVCDHLVSGVETEFGNWTACSVCGTKSWAQTALSAYKGSGTTHTGQAVFLPKEGGNPTVAADMVKQSVTVSDVAVSYNLLNKDKSLPYLEFTYTITVEEAMTVNVYVNGRSTNTSNNVNAKVQINKFMKLFQGDTEIAIGDSAAFPAYREGYNYWNEQQVATLDLVEGTNTFTFRFLKDIKFNSSKAYGGYISYFRFAEASKLEEGCEDNVHNIEKVKATAPCCFDGMKEHYVCKDCGELFDIENKLPTEAKYLTIPRIYYNHVYENVARLQDDGTYAYQCTRGCGTTKAHTCTGEGKYLVIAKEPNQVWYEEGDSFNPDRMELYLSTACAEGCSGNTVVAGHLSGYDALTFTYQNGDSFKAGDEYITINYKDGDETLSVNLPVTVTAVGGTITVDDSDEGFSFVDKLSGQDSGSRTAGHRTNDQGRVGQSAYGGSYVNNFDNGDTATFKFTLDEAANGANIVLRASSERMNAAGGTPPRGYAISVNDVVIIKIDGQIVEFSDDVILKGTVDTLEQTANRWVWTNWMNLDLGTYDLAAGEHTVEIIIDTTLSASVAGTDTNAYTASIQLDCLNVFLGE